MAKKYQGIFETQKPIIKDHGFLKFEDIKREIQVLPVFKAFITPLNIEEFTQLESNIKQEGCREAIIVWETKRGKIDSFTKFPDETAYVLIDGHHRFEICQKWGLDYKILLVQYENEEQVKDFMIDNQLGRRNINAEQASYLRGLKYNSEKKIRGAYDREKQSGQNVHFGQVAENPLIVLNKPEGKDQSGQNVHFGQKTAQVLAEKFNVNEKTIRRDAEFATGVEKLPDAIKQEILSGKSKYSKADVIQIGKLDDIEIQEKLNTFTAKEPIVKPKESIKEKIIKLIQQLDNLSDLEEIHHEIKIIRDRGL